MEYRSALFSSLVICLLCACVPKKVIPLPDNISDYLIQENNLSKLRIDNIGNIFAVKNNRSLYQYDSKGILLRTYDDQNSGFIYSVDTYNPLYILIYYRDANRISILDRNLAILNEISVLSLTQNDITAVSIANDNNLWLYDNTERKVKKYSVKGQLILESLDLYGMTNLNTTVTHIMEHENRVLMRNDESKIIVTDNFGNYIRDIEIVSDIPWSPQKSAIYAQSRNIYQRIPIGDNTLEEVSIIRNDVEHYSGIYFFKSKLYAVDSFGVRMIDL